MLLQLERERVARGDSGVIGNWWERYMPHSLGGGGAGPRAYLAPRRGPLNPGGGNALDTDTVGRAKSIHDGLMKRGLDDDTSWGFAANAVQESRAMWNSNPGDMGAAHGAFMWRDDRLKRYLAKYGHLPEQGSLDEQLDYVMAELGGTESNAAAAIRFAPGGPAGKGAAVSQFYERPKDKQDEIDRRSSMAERLATANAAGAPGASGHVQVDVHIKGAPHGTTAAATGTGAVMASPPRIETSMPGGGG
jgi:hypothetical protein